MNFDVITIGTATRDIFLKSAGFRVLRDPRHLEGMGFKTGEAECFALGAKIEIDRPITTVGGGATNAAVTFARLGFKTTAIAKIGKDEFGEAISETLKKEKIKANLIKDESDGTAYSTILVTSDGERTILHYRGASQDLSKKEISLKGIKAKWAYIAPGNISFEVMKDIIRTLKKSRTKIAMNPSKSYLSIGSKKLRPMLDNLDVVSLNREEASYLTGVDYKNETEIFKNLNDLIKGIVIMTDGPRGSLVSDHKHIYRAGIFKEKKLVDRTGAGDAYGSGFVAGFMKTGKIEYALRLAAANSTAVVESFGAQGGILKQKDFENIRFRDLDIKIENIE